MSNELGEIISLDDLKNIKIEEDAVISLKTIVEGDYLSEIHDTDGLRVDCPKVPYNVQQELYNKAVKKHKDIFFCNGFNYHSFTHEEEIGVFFWYNTKDNSTHMEMHDSPIYSNSSGSSNNN